MRKKLYILIIIILLLFIGVLIIYKFSNKTLKVNEHYFEYAEIKNFKTDDETEVNDKEKYANYIIKDKFDSINYSFFHDENSITGRMYIGDDKNCYIEDTNKNYVYEVSTERFSTLYSKDYEYTDGIYGYGLSEDNKIYMISLESNDIFDAYIYDYRYAERFTNFVDIEYKYDMYVPGNSVFALTEEGKIYDINTGLRYDERTISLYNQIYVYHDKTMTNIYGHLIEDKEGKRYKIKNIFEIIKGNDFIKDEKTIVIITEENEFIYFDKEMMYVYEFDKKVKDIKFSEYYPYIRGKLNIIFEDDYKVEFTAKCNQYYCVNKFLQ